MEGAKSIGYDSQQKVITLLKSFQQNPKIVEKLPEKNIMAMLETTRHYYYNTGTPIITDDEYDLLIELFETRFPGHPYLEAIGATVVTGKKVKLPYYLGSMDKIKPDTQALEKWKVKYPEPAYVLTDKLDGVSALLVNKVVNVTHFIKRKGKTYKIKRPRITMKLYTRGRGSVGQDISGLIPFLNLPLIPKNFAARGELIIPRKVFAKNTMGMRNSRNMVSGLVNSKVYNPLVAKMTCLVLYELISPRKRLSTQLSNLTKFGFKVVLSKNISTLTNAVLSEYLLERREHSVYECDGIIVTANQEFAHPTSGNPKFAFAFKMVLDEQKAETFVLDVEWNPSKDGFLKPRIVVQEVVLPDCTINYSTGYNAKFILDNKIGPGAKIELVRSGDVIPIVTKVLSPATKLKLPSEPYVWNATKVDFVLADVASNKQVKAKRTLKFFTTLDVPLMKVGTVSKFLKHGHDLNSIIHAGLADIAKIKGLEGDMGKKVFKAIRHTLSKVDLSPLMAASNCFGRGFNRKKMDLLLETYPNILDRTPSIDELLEVKGFSHKTIEPLLLNLDSFREFVVNLPSWITVVIPTKVVTQDPSSTTLSHSLYKKKVVMSGTRDKKVNAFLQEVQANISTSVSKNTHLVIVKDVSSTSAKIEKAKNLGVGVLTIDEFLEEFMSS